MKKSAIAYLTRVLPMAGGRPLKARRPVAGESVDRITLSIASEDNAALGKIADEKKVSIVWIIREAITKYLSKKSEA